MEQGIREAMYWKPLEGEAGKAEKVGCLLCPQACKIAPGKRGLCTVRENRDGKLYTLVYGNGSSANIDPIEKKPLYHLRPGSSCLSFGTAGCNLKCQHCQNFHISQVPPEDLLMKHFTVEGVVELAKNSGVDGVSWTYNEPTVWFEFTLDASKALKKEGFYVTYVSNGYINPEPFREIAPFLDGINVDVKAHSEDFYRKVCKAELAPVHRTCELAVELGVHLELTYLIIPTKNDTEEQFQGFSGWVMDKLGPDVPVHYSAFHPDNKMRDLPRTPSTTLMKAFDISKKAGIRYVYVGNVPHGDYENTYCPKCGTKLIERFGFSAQVLELDGDKCGKCGTKIPMRM